MSPAPLLSCRLHCREELSSQNLHKRGCTVKVIKNVRTVEPTFYLGRTISKARAVRTAPVSRVQQDPG